jgi:hypothetical protein
MVVHVPYTFFPDHLADRGVCSSAWLRSRYDVAWPQLWQRLRMTDLSGPCLKAA